MSSEDRSMTIQEVARLTGITTRTLRWYDELGLVVPERSEPANYRLYRTEHLKKLQQVLFFRELQFPLDQIRDILTNPRFNRKRALERQLGLLREKKRTMDELLSTLELALKEEKGEYTMRHEERFKGFDFSHNPYEDDARKIWGDEPVDEANEKLAAMGAQQKNDLSDSMNTVFAKLAEVRHLDPDSLPAQKVIGQWYDLLNTMGNYTPEMFANLGRMYVDDQRFTKNIDRFGDGLARFMMDAMLAYAKKKG